MIRKALGDDFKVESANDYGAALQTFRKKRFEFTFIDVHLLDNVPGVEEQELSKEALKPFWKAFPSAHIIILTPRDQVRKAVSLVKAGAGDYLTYPIDASELKLVLESIAKTQHIESELLYLRERLTLLDLPEGARTNSPLMKHLLDDIASVALTRTTVLLTGETGTGKGVTARLIHHLSNRSDKPYVSVHSGAIPETLIESELFGHEKGSFTGAVRRKLGKFEIAHTGTLFLDEISTISEAVQIKLLQALQEKIINRVGGVGDIEVDVRIVAATNVDLRKLTEEGVFRKDLFYRLNVFPIKLPPLRERLEDIPLLTDSFISTLNRNYNKDINGIDNDVLDAFTSYPWPGNIRELENIIERAYIIEKGKILTAGSFPAEIFAYPISENQSGTDRTPTLAEVKRRALDSVEKQFLHHALTANKGRIDKTAQTAGITTRQLHNLMRKYNLIKERYKVNSDN